MNKLYNNLPNHDLELLERHLKGRFLNTEPDSRFSIVFDISKDCNLRCVGCGTNAVYHGFSPAEHMTSFCDIECVLRKCREYADETKKQVFINFGGGEPFLRNDIVQIIKMASDYFGAENVGIDTNGTLDQSYELIGKVMPYLSYVGISVNGLENYHNWWANVQLFPAYQRTMRLIEELCKNEKMRTKIEVTTVATKKNLPGIIPLIKKLHSIGVQNYSVHRAIPVGRMSIHQDIIPSAKEYFTLLLKMLRFQEANHFNVHLHHSIESIFAAKLFGINTYSEKLGTPNRISSVGIGPNGDLLFDPWCTTGIWKTLSWGNIIRDDRKLVNIIQDTRYLDLKDFTRKENRCHGCEVNCSGGSRIVAAATALYNLRNANPTPDILLEALKSIDPACPDYLV